MCNPLGRRKKINFEEFLNIIGKDTKLIEQSESFVKKFLKKKKIIKNLPISGGLPGSSGGGGGNELLLYYITRLLKPNIVLESEFQQEQVAQQFYMR